MKTTQLKNTAKIIGGFTLVFICAGCGISAGSLKNDPGFAKFQYPSFWEADKEISISLGPTILNFARGFIEEDEEAAQILEGVKGLHLRVYNIEDNLDALVHYVDESADQLSHSGWERLVTVKQNDEHVAVMVKMDDDEIQGMVVLVAEPEEAVFINVIGNIKPEALQPLIAQVYDDAPDVLTTL